MQTDDELDLLVVDFVAETRENLDRLERDLVALEDAPADDQLAASAFRALHTVKGTSGYFDFGRVTTLAHRAENVLAALRDGGIRPSTASTTALLHAVDALRALVDGIDETGSEPEQSTDAVQAELDDCLEATPAAPRQRFGETLVAAGAVTPGDITWAVSRQSEGDRRPIGEILLAAGLVDENQIESVLTLQGRTAPGAAVRVDVRVLEDLVRLTGELSVAAADLPDDPRSARVVEALAALRGSVMRTRVEPVSRAWLTLPRQVRDASEATGKKVLLLTEGADTLLDRALLPAVTAAVTHLVRNAIDHGVEPPVVRRRLGKPAAATLTVRARTEASWVVVEVCDDGQGVDVDKVARTARERGLLDDDVAAVTTAQAVRLILRPGFSTAAGVTQLSGRGVGLDAVRHDVEQVGGTLEMRSVPGQGCAVRLRLPHVEAGAS
jgi:two-component system chemotaxis sensor kinase CheA